MKSVTTLKRELKAERDVKIEFAIKSIIRDCERNIAKAEKELKLHKDSYKNFLKAPAKFAVANIKREEPRFI